jgi:hypothetical protein
MVQSEDEESITIISQLTDCPFSEVSKSWIYRSALWVGMITLIIKNYTLLCCS